MPLKIFCMFLLSALFVGDSVCAGTNYDGIAEGKGALSIVDEGGAATSDESGSALFGFDEDDYVSSSEKLKEFDGKILLKEVRFHGNECVTKAELNAIAAAYVNRRVGFKELNALKKAIHAFCAKKGLLFHRVLLPTQDVRDGDVDIWVRESNIHRITLTADPCVRKRLRPYVDRLRKCVKAADYERTFLLMQKLPGFVVTAIVSPIKDQPTRLEMHIVVREDKFHGSVGVSNTLLKREVGPWAGSVSLNFSNIFGINERWEFGVQTTHPFRELLNISGSLSVPVGSQGFSLTGGWSQFWTEASFVDAKKKTEHPSGQPSCRHRYKFGAAMPLYLRFGREVSTEFAFYNFGSVRKVFDPSIPIASRKDPLREVDETYNFMRLKLRSKFRVGRVSHVILLSGSYQPRTQGGYVQYDWLPSGGDKFKKTKTETSAISRARALFLSYTMHAALPHNIGLSLLLGGQWSFDSRQEIDLFRAVGDARSTYAYPVGALSNESGFSARASVSKTIPLSKRVFVAPYVFSTYGAAWWHKKQADHTYRYADLHSWGLGLECSVARSVTLKGEYAHPLGSMKRPLGRRAAIEEKRFVFSISISM